MSEYGFKINVTNLASAKMAEVQGSMVSMQEQASVSTKRVAEDFNLMGERMGETFKNLKSLLLTGLGITALFEGWEFIENSKIAFEGLEKQIARVDTVLKSTNFKAGFSSEDIQDQAKDISRVIVNKRDEILQAQGTLLSYTNIRGNVFKEATKAVADYSTFFNTDLAGGARILGRALQDPLQGINELRRAGIVLTDEQKKQIKNYEAQGHLVKAQSVLLDELNKKFGGQAAAYALTDAGKIQVASKQWEELQFKLGEIISRVEVSLIPSFTKIINVIRDAFNSSTIQFFINDIKDVVSVVLKLIPIWITYKAVMIASTLATEGMVLFQKILAVSMGNTALAVDGAIVSLDGFKAALVSTGIGALIIGVGLLVEKFISMNDEIGETVNKLTNIKEITAGFRQSQESAEKINVAFSNLKNLTPGQKSSLATDIEEQIKTIKNKLTTSVVPQIPFTQKQIAKSENLNKKFSYNPFDATESGLKYATGRQTSDLKEALKDNKNAIAGYTKTLHDLQSKQLQLQRLGIKAASYTDPTSGVKGSAINTSNLSGASGGLGQARQIFLHIDTFQKNEGVRESKSQADQAIEKLTELINSFTSSENSQ